MNPASPAHTIRPERPEDHLDIEDVIREVNIASNKVHNLSIELHDVTEKLGKAEIDDNGEVDFGAQMRWETAIENRIQEIVDDYEKRDKRAPGYDACLSRAKRHVRLRNPELFVEYMQLTTRQKALRDHLVNEKQVISGKQTVLNGLRAIGA